MASASVLLKFAMLSICLVGPTLGSAQIRLGARYIESDRIVDSPDEVPATDSAEPNGGFLSFDPSFDDIVKGSRIETLVTTNAHEGPVYVADGNYFIWTTQPQLTCLRTFKCFYSYIHIMKYEIDTAELSVFRNHSNMANGQYLDRKGRLLTCEQGGHWQHPEPVDAPAAITRTDLKTGKREVLIDNYFGFSLNSPNDIVEKSDGTIWFTDPSYGHLQGFRDAPCLGQYVYRLDPETKKMSVVADDLMEPNGLAFSPDEKTLYLTDTAAFMSPLEGLRPDRPRHILAYDVVEGRFLANKRLFAVVAPGIPDGIKVDYKGNVYTGAEDGIHVFNKLGDLIGKILIQGSVNLYFGGPEKNILFVTADTRILKMKLNTHGVSPV